MAGHAEFVALGVSKVRAVIVLVVLGPEALCAFGGASAGQGQSVYLVDAFTRLGEEGNHLAIARNMGLSVVRRAEKEQRSWPRNGLPASPTSFPLEKPRLNAKHISKRCVESESAVEVAGANEDVREHRNQSANNRGLLW